MTRTECKNLASMSQYVAGDGKTYSISMNVRKGINYFAKWSATAYVGFYGSQITCTGGKLKVDGSDIHKMVMYMTEEILYHAESSSREMMRTELSLISIMFDFLAR